MSEGIVAEKGQVMILVTGATGTVGREAIGVLRGRGAEVAAVTRDPSTAALPDGVQVIGADPSKPQTLSSALDGVEAVLLSPRAVSGATAELLSMAADRGAKRVVVLSAATVEYPVGQRRFVEEFESAEENAKASGLAWTFLRSADFAANALAWAPQIRAGGVVRGAYSEAATSPIHQRDIATVAADALLNAGYEGHSYILTGPQSLNQYDKVRLIGQTLGRELTFAEMPPEEIRQGMLAQGLPEEIPDRLLGSLADYALKPGPTTDTVQRLLGRPALSFAEWASENAAAFQN